MTDARKRAETTAVSISGTARISYNSRVFCGTPTTNMKSEEVAGTETSGLGFSHIATGFCHQRSYM